MLEAVGNINNNNSNKVNENVAQLFDAKFHSSVSHLKSLFVLMLV